MPAINPSRLAREVEAVAAAFDDPAALRRQAVDLLDLYADRARRAPSPRVIEEPRAFNVPKPVLTALERALLPRASQAPEKAILAASALWEAGYRETRLLAAALLASNKSSEAADWSEPRAMECEDNVALARLAREGLSGWVAADTAGFLERVAGWLASPRPRLRALGLLSIEATAADPGFRELPALFRLLQGLPGAGRGAGGTALEAAVETLARRSPPETVRFLLDEMEQGTLGAERLARRVAEVLPPGYRQYLKHH